MIRLQKYIADCGIASRRRAEELIVNSKVEVNGRTIRELGTKIDPEKDKVWVLGKAITSRMLKVPTKNIIKRSKPRASPPWGGAPCCSAKASRTAINRPHCSSV